MANSFRDDVYEVVAQIPHGKVATYGQVAVLCGHPGAARVVGQIAHFGDPDLPWQRVVNASGGLARGFPGGRAGHQQVLEDEGLVVKNFGVDLERYQWRP